MKRKITCGNYFIILEKKVFKRAHKKIQKLMFGLAQTLHFGLWDIIPPPPEFQLAFHICYVKYENTLTCKRISWELGGDDVLKYFSISYMFTKSDHFSPKIKPYIHGNRKLNAKSQNRDQQRAYI